MRFCLFNYIFSVFRKLVSNGIFDDERFNNKSPSETLSPTLTSILSILPEMFDGISTLDLSLSIVTIGSFSFISSPGFTSISITSTFLNSPISEQIIFCHLKIYTLKFIII